jgi:hypothetical protein
MPAIRCELEIEERHGGCTSDDFSLAIAVSSHSLQSNWIRLEKEGRA